MLTCLKYNLHNIKGIPPIIKEKLTDEKRQKKTTRGLWVMLTGLRYLMLQVHQADKIKTNHTMSIEIQIRG